MDIEINESTDIAEGDNNMSVDSVSKTRGCEEETLLVGGPRFCPPLYIQRYGFVRHLLEQYSMKTVADIGCAECKILTLMKTVKTLQTILLVDIDERLLKSYEYCIRPALDDFLHRRDNPLHIQLLAGSAAILDQRMVGLEAVTLVEIIEHLQPDILNGVVENIFGNIQPLLVVVTTPNSDFNVLFPDFTGFRHWDHKFEWSRKEFGQWCISICGNYGYTVKLTGIGDPPTDSQHVGCCSQAAIFTRTSDFKKNDQNTSATLTYKQISECHYPYKEKKLTLDEELDNEVSYYIRQRCLHAYETDAEESLITISVEDISNIKNMKTLCDTEYVRKYLDREYEMSIDGASIEVNIDHYISHCLYSDDEENDEDGPEKETVPDLENKELIYNTNEEEDWV